MDITLSHTIVPTLDNVASARFYEKIFGFTFVKEWGHFAVVRVNPTLVLDFQTSDEFFPIHYAFKVSEQQFDEIFERIKMAKIDFGSGPYAKNDGQINHNNDGRGLYFKDPNGHVLEIITVDYNID